MVQSWMNNDGLYLKYGVDKTPAKKAGEYRTYGQLHEWEVKIDLTTLSTSAQTIIDDTVLIPKNYRIQEIVVIGETAATSSGSGTIDIGLIRTDRTTELDYDGFVAALAKTAVDAAGEQNTLVIGSTSVGALVGTTLSNSGHIVAKVSAAYQTGVLKVKIRAYRP